MQKIFIATYQNKIIKKEKEKEKKNNSIKKPMS
jgi:hypothetical protein